MTHEQINIAIGTACGLENINGRWWNKDMPIRLPDYAGSLNAMHEAEKIFSLEMASRYVTILCLEVQEEASLYNATAAQRAEAFLRTLNLWTE